VHVKRDGISQSRTHQLPDRVLARDGAADDRPSGPEFAAWAVKVIDGLSASSDDRPVVIYPSVRHGAWKRRW